jgi:riboflavin kinase/FMN adenylyltransferase
LKIYQDIENFAKVDFPVVTVGTFDGLHLGHQKIIHRMNELAHVNNGETVLVTFDPHPRLVVNSSPYDIKFINTKKRKFHLLEKLGIDHLIIIPFTKEFAKTSSEDFIREYLIDQIGVKKLIVGYDHHFGRNREGNYQKLYALGEKYNFEVEEISAQYIDNVPVSSTKIRNALIDGDVKVANKMLGYEYSITGVVVGGNKIGRSIGFPTANIEIEDKYKLIAAGGVYACKVEVAGTMYFGMGNIGTRPTVGINGLVTEVNIFDFDEEIYGQEITIFFLERIRDEQKFNTIEELKNQLINDERKVKEMISINR